MKSNLDFLVKDESRFKPMLREKLFVSIYVILILATYFLCVTLIDIRRDDDLTAGYFYFETFLLFAVALFSSVLTYRLLTPAKNIGNLAKLFSVSLLAYLGSLLYRIPKSDMLSQFYLETDMSRGGCGVLITIFSLSSFFVLYHFVLKNGYVFKKALFSLSLACATCSIGAISMQVICEHESVAHVLVYHAPPFIALGLIFFIWQKRTS